jgi:hypothetical protein
MDVARIIGEAAANIAFVAYGLRPRPFVKPNRKLEKVTNGY